MKPQKAKQLLRKALYLSKKSKNAGEEILKKEADKKGKVYDSIKYRRESGRDSHTIDELRDKFKNILESLKEKNMLTQEGRNILNRPRIKRDFELTSKLVNSQGQRFLDRIYRRHQG